MRELLVFSFALLLSACGGGGGGGSSSGGSSSTPTVTAQNAPDAIPSGAVMSVNPTFSFSGGSFTYSNDNPAGQFTASVANGLYTYIPYTGGTDQEATITFQGDGAADGKIFSGAGFRKAAKVNFVGTASQLTGGTMTIDGAAYTLTLSGTPMMPGKGRSGGGTVVNQSVLPASLTGSYSLAFGLDKAVAGCPYKQGDKAGFSIVGDSVTVGGVTMTPTALGGIYYRCSNGAVAYVIEMDILPHPPGVLVNDYWTIGNITVLVNDVFAGKFSATAEALPANDPTKPAIGKTWTGVVTASRNDTGDTSFSPIGAVLTGSWGVVPAGSPLFPTVLHSVPQDFAADLGFADPVSPNLYSSSYSTMGNGASAHGVISVRIDPATNLISEMTRTETYESGKINSMTVKVIGL